MSDLIKHKAKKHAEGVRRMLMRGSRGRLNKDVVESAVKDSERRYSSHLTGLETARKRRAERHRQTVDMFEDAT